MRNLLIFVLILVAVWWIRRAFRKPGGGEGGRRRRRGEPERILACARCGVHVPESEGVREGETFYCCEEHRRLGAQR